jgi:folate-binding protein YgfZ
MTSAYRAAREHAAHADRSDRIRVEVTGAQAAATLNGLLTNDVAVLRPGTGCYAAALTAKGKVIADVRVFAHADGFLVDTSAAAGPGFTAMLAKYVNPRLAKVRNVTAETANIGVFGPDAAARVSALCGLDLAAVAALEPYAHLNGARGGAPYRVARVPDLGVDGYDVLLPAADARALLDDLRAAGVVPLDPATADILRVEAGRPAWGADMDETTLAQEAALDAPHLAAISFTKGCYTGQETVARVHFRGHVNRELRGMRAAAPLAPGSLLAHDAAPDAGLVRSAVVSPRLGPVALAYVRREVPDGADVTIRTPDGDLRATVVALPFA